MLDRFRLAYRRGVTIPLSAHSFAHESSHEAAAGPAASARRARRGLMFHGGTGRYDFGLRDAMLNVLRRVAAPRAAHRGRPPPRARPGGGPNASRVGRPAPPVAAHTAPWNSSRAPAHVDVRVAEISRGNTSALRRRFDERAYAESGHSYCLRALLADVGDPFVFVFRRSRRRAAGAFHRYLNASLCLSPAGDVPSSRRLFDAMAAGCIPVLVRSLYQMNK